jgi:hypothetical protein
MTGMEQSIDNQQPAQRTAEKLRTFNPGAWAAVIYLVLVATGTAWAIHSTMTWDGPDANLAGVIPYLITAPWSLIPLAFLDLSADGMLNTILFVFLPVLGALINAAILYAVVQKLTDLASRRPPRSNDETRSV